MRLQRIRLLTASLFLLLVTLPSMPAAEQRPISLANHGSANGKIKGLVLDANKARVGNAGVRVWNGQTERRTQSSEEGEFEIELPAGNYRVTVEADGFCRYISSWLKVRPGETKALSVGLTVAETQGLTLAS